MIELFLNTQHHSLKAELNRFFQQKFPLSFGYRNLSSAAVTKARPKFKASAFIELLHKAVDYAYHHLPRTKQKGWHGFRTLAVDGSDLTLPNKPSLLAFFGGHGNNNSPDKPMAKLSCLYDVYLDLPIDAQLDRKHASERELAIRHLEVTKDNDLLLYDRGYYAYWFVLEHTLRERAFCLRLRSNANKQIKAFTQSNKKQAIITLNPSEGMCKQTHDKGLECIDITVRLIRIKTSKGQYVLMTSLTDKKRYPMKDFYALYHARWRVEEGYKVQKAFLEVENFSGQTVHSIQQDVHASILIHALSALACIASKTSITQAVIERKKDYKINVAMIIRSLKGSLIALLTGKMSGKNIYLWLKYLAKELSIIKPNRSFERCKVRCRREMYRTGYK